MSAVLQENSCKAELFFLFAASQLKPLLPPFYSGDVFKKQNKKTYDDICRAVSRRPVTVQTTFIKISCPRWPFKTHMIPLHDKEKGQNKQIPVYSFSVFSPFSSFSALMVGQK